MSKEKREQVIKDFHPDENGLSSHGIFGLPFSPEESQIVLLPVPWEVTVSYGEGTAHGPAAILKASQQLDLYDPVFPGGWKVGIAMKKPSASWNEANTMNRAQSALYLQEYEELEELSPNAKQVLSNINKITAELHEQVKAHSLQLLNQGKFVGIVGGEHSVPLGYLQALAEQHESFGILQIDAHADLRNAYEGFEFSHASIMFNALKIPNISKLVQVGIRDISEGEQNYIEQSNGRVALFADHQLKRAAFEGESWKATCKRIIAQLPDKVYISFDIDGLQPWLCPNTGTPVAGGLLLEEASYLLEQLVASGKKIIGFDLCEVAPGADEWDGNVGARVLYKLCLLSAKSNGLS